MRFSALVMALWWAAVGHARREDLNSTTVITLTNLNCTTSYDSLRVRPVPHTTTRTTIYADTTFYPNFVTDTTTVSPADPTTTTSTYTTVNTSTTFVATLSTTLTFTNTSFYSTCSPNTFTNYYTPSSSPFTSSALLSKRAAKDTTTALYPTDVTCGRSLTVFTLVTVFDASTTTLTTGSPQTTITAILTEVDQVLVSATVTEIATDVDLVVAYPTGCTPPASAACVEEYQDYGCEYGGGYSACGCWQDSYGSPTCFNITSVGTGVNCVNNIDCGPGSGCMYGAYDTPYCAAYDHCFDLGYPFPSGY